MREGTDQMGRIVMNSGAVAARSSQTIVARERRAEKQMLTRNCQLMHPDQGASLAIRTSDWRVETVFNLQTKNLRMNDKNESEKKMREGVSRSFTFVRITIELS
jgi:hypothetical protein